jgi:MFS family permease
MKRVLPIIVIAQFFCTSVWFAGNVVMRDLAATVVNNTSYLAHLTSAVQIGFISGTLLFAVLAIADRFSPSYVFFTCALLAAIFNLAICLDSLEGIDILILRFLTGFCLAGIYPVGMKITADHFKDGLGKSLGFLVGALVLGTAFPHLVKGSIIDVSWLYVVYSTSALSLCGGLLVFFFVPDGPYRKTSSKLRFTDFGKGFKNKNFRAAAFGYFGHMWELYAFWTFLPLMISHYQNQHPDIELSNSLLSFSVIAVGAPACVCAGLLSQRISTQKIAFAALGLSFLCCLLSPFLLQNNSIYLFFAFLFIWGISVIADSPLFSSLVAKHAPNENKGSALTIVNCIGFSITILSIEFINSMSKHMAPHVVYSLLAIGPFFGLWSLINMREKVMQ